MRGARRTPRLLLLLLPAASLLAAGPAEVSEGYARELAEFRASREERLRSPTGWLTLAALDWLSQGENGFGADPESAVVIAAEGVPARAGTLVVDGLDVTLRAAPGADVRIDDEPVTERVLRDDHEEETDVVQVGRLRFHIIRRGERLGVRVKDPEHPRLKEFRGLEYFPIDPAFRIDAAFRPYDEPREVVIGTVAGTSATMLAPGVVEFDLEGRSCSLQPLVSEPGQTSLWFIFRDKTNGRETYGFRYLYAELADGRVDLDFNRAYNPPCAFSPFATCPLPPRGNRLPVRIAAGERNYRP